MFTLSRNSLTVPAGGRATVTVTADTRVGTEDGAFTGYLAATGGGVQVRSPLAVAREVESYDLTLVHTGRDGTPSNAYSTLVIPADAELAIWGIGQSWGSSSTVTLRLPKGRYIIDSTIVGAEDTTMLNQPKVELNASRQVNLDARLGKPIRVGVPDRSAISVWAEVDTISHQGNSSRGSSMIGSSFAGMYTARIGPQVSEPFVTAVVNSVWARPGPDGTITDSPEIYHLTWVSKGSDDHRVQPAGHQPGSGHRARRLRQPGHRRSDLVIRRRDDSTVARRWDRLITRRRGTRLQLRRAVQFSVPADEGTCRLQIEADRGAPGTLSTRTSVAWTFRSAYTTTRTALPLSVVRFSPKLNALNTARARGKYAVPVTVTPQPGPTATALTTLTVEVSSDDGGTWQPAPLQRAGDQTIATLQRPNRDGFVSLRATSTDANGTRVEQTIIRAYRISTEPGD